MGFVIPICGAITLVAMAESGIIPEYRTLLLLAFSGWGVIGFYSGCKVFGEWLKSHKRKQTEILDSREKFFEVLNGAYDLQDRLKLLQKDASRSVNGIHTLGKEAGYYDKPS
jgi:hypothetical protein